MSLITCPSCKGPVSTEANACPKGGHRFPRGLSKQSPILIIGTIFLGIIIVILLA